MIREEIGKVGRDPRRRPLNARLRRTAFIFIECLSGIRFSYMYSIHITNIFSVDVINFLLL